MPTHPEYPALSALDRHELLQAGLDQLDQGLTVIDGNLQIVAWNRAFVELLEFPPEMAYVGATFESFMRYNAERGEYGPGDVDALVAERLRLARMFTPHYTERERPGGQTLAVRGVPLPHNGFVTLYTDITETRRYERLLQQQHAELEHRVAQRTTELQASNQQLREAHEVNQRITEALRRSEERQRLITDSVPALIGYFDHAQIYRYVNKGYAEWFGHTKEAMLGHSILEMVGPEVYADIAPHVQQALQGQRVSYEYAKRGPDGQLTFARSELVPERDPDGQVAGCFVLSVNITDLKNAQAALVHAQKMEAMGQLTGGLAHDFNNLLTVVIGNLTALAQRHPDPALVQEFVDPALKASHRGAALIKRLLAFARHQPLAPQPVDIAAQLADALVLLRRTLPAPIDIQTRVLDGPLWAQTDAHQLENAVLNLALNARDAMPDGGQLRIEAGRQVLQAEAAAELDLPEGPYVALTVSDTGVGMDAATQARACEPFFTTKRFGSGSGLGLSMVYGFARQSGGGLRLRSAPGQGCAVTLMLPWTTPQAHPPEHAADADMQDPPTDHPLVLLVEDDPDVRRVIRLQLVSLGYPVIEAEHSADALHMLASVPAIRILVSDVVMPGGMDGRLLCQQALRTTPGLQALLISGYADDTAGLDSAPVPLPLLKKPFTTEALRLALEALCP